MSNYDERLRAEIERIGVSKLAKAMDIARNTLYNWCEKGNVPLDRFIELGNNGVDTYFVMTGNRLESSLAPEENVLLDGFRELDQATRKRVLAFIFGGGESPTTSNVVTKNENSGAGIQNNAKKVTQTVNNAPTSNIKIGKQKGDIVSGDKISNR